MNQAHLGQARDRFNNCPCAQDIGSVEGLGRRRFHHAGQVDDRIRARHKPPERFRIRQIADDGIDPRQGEIVTAGNAPGENPDRPAASCQLADDVGADETRCSGNGDDTRHGLGGHAMPGQGGSIDAAQIVRFGLGAAQLAR